LEKKNLKFHSKVILCCYPNLPVVLQIAMVDILMDEYEYILVKYFPFWCFKYCRSVNDIYTNTTTYHDHKVLIIIKSIDGHSLIALVAEGCLFFASDIDAINSIVLERLNLQLMHAKLDCSL